MVLCDRCGTRMPAVRATMEAKIGRVYRGLDLSIDCFPGDDVQDDPDAALKVWLCGTHVPAATATDEQLCTNNKLYYCFLCWSSSAVLS